MAAEAGLARAAAASGIHGGDQHEARRIGDAMIGARDRDLAGLERLAAGVGDPRVALGELVAGPRPRRSRAAGAASRARADRTRETRRGTRRRRARARSRPAWRAIRRRP